MADLRYKTGSQHVDNQPYEVRSTLPVVHSQFGHKVPLGASVTKCPMSMTDNQTILRW